VELFWSILLAVSLLLAAVGLMVWHVRSWQFTKRHASPAEERDYRFRQFRRRMQTSGMLGFIAAALPVGVAVMRAWPKVGVFYWGGVLLLVGWLGLLALADIVATGHYYGRLRRDYTIEEARLHAELNRLQKIRGNGKATVIQEKKKPSTRNDGMG
jgi:hypothetical protein